MVETGLGTPIDDSLSDSFLVDFVLLEVSYFTTCVLLRVRPYHVVSLRESGIAVL